jgi:hypothetical protein
MYPDSAGKGNTLEVDLTHPHIRAYTMLSNTDLIGYERNFYPAKPRQTLSR